MAADTELQPLSTVNALAQRLAAGETTAGALAREALDRAEARDGEGARVFTQRYAARATGLARISDQGRALGLRRSVIDGLPVSVKDLFDVAGEPTTAGSVVLRDAAPAAADAEVVSRLLQAGAVLVGKTNMTEFAYSGLGINPHYGTPANPWRRAERRIPGGSSSGAAVAVADGMCCASVGSDTGGSIRIPAAFCGLTGFKPTARRVSRRGVLPLSQALDSVGVIAPDVASCIAVDGVISGDPLPLAGWLLSRARFAVPETVVLDGLDEYVARTFERTLERLSAAGALVERMALPEFQELAAINAGGGFNAAEAWAWHADLLATREAEYDPRVASRIRRGAGMSARDFIELGQARAAWIERVERRIAGFDALLMPTVPIVAPRIADLEADEERYFRTNGLVLRNPTFINFLDGCACSVPCHEAGEAPVGLMVAGPALSDAAVAQWARAVETELSR